MRYNVGNRKAGGITLMKGIYIKDAVGMVLTHNLSWIIPAEVYMIIKDERTCEACTYPNCGFGKAY